jgi:phage/plasmid-like protein (TIGR03299 family)
MAHDIATANGQPAMMYCGPVPWHGLGTRLEGPATALEAIEAAGLSYQAELKELRTVEGRSVPQRRAVVRSDTGDVLGVVGKSYVPVQNSQAFSFLDAVVADGGLRYHTAGALGKGERVWMLAKLPGQIRIKGGDDVVDKFLLLSNSHNGTAALRIQYTPIRVVCSNTLNLALRHRGARSISIVHKGDLALKIEEAQRVLGFADMFFQDTEAKIDLLANHYPTTGQVEEYFKALYPDRLDTGNNRIRNIRSQLKEIFETGIGMDIPAIKGTSWAAFNALTEFVDHHRPTRTSDPTLRKSRRLESAWFGSGATLKARAWNEAIALAIAG